MYTLLVCADLYGEKVNLELTFPAMPTIGELQRKINECFSSEGQMKRPQGYPAIEFTVARLQIYDDVLLKWTDLVTCTQLHEYDQLYAFQPQSPWHIDVQKDLPPPRPPSANVQMSSSQPRPQYDAPPTGGGSPAHMQPYGSPTPQQQQHYHHNGGTPYGQQQRMPEPQASARGVSPTTERLQASRQKEEQLRAELARVHEENLRLEQAAQQEAEEQRRRSSEDQERMLRQREAELERQRQALRQAEEEFQRAQASMGRR